MMEYQKIMNFLENTPNKPNLEQKVGLRYMTTHVEPISLIVKLNLKRQC